MPLLSPRNRVKLLEAGDGDAIELVELADGTQVLVATSGESNWKELVETDVSIVLDPARALHLAAELVEWARATQLIGRTVRVLRGGDEGKDFKVLRVERSANDQWRLVGEGVSSVLLGHVDVLGK